MREKDSYRGWGGGAISAGTVCTTLDRGDTEVAGIKPSAASRCQDQITGQLKPLAPRWAVLDSKKALMIEGSVGIQLGKITAHVSDPLR